MAYFGFNYYEAEPGVYLPIPYDFAPLHHSLTPSVGAYDPAPTRSEISYSVSAVTQSKVVVVYDPAPPNGGVYDPFHTQITVSYNKTGFNAPDFEDYDPTPYGGGYDIAQTYGKPLPPSDDICYPRASASEPQKGSQPTATTADKEDEKETVEQQQSHGGTGDVLISGNDDGHGSNLEEPLGSSQSGETEGNYYDDYYPWTGYEYEYGNGRSDTDSRGYGYEKQVPDAPWGYSPEAMEFCESIFGQWPCLNRHKKYGHQGATNEESNKQWKGTADFLFGSSSPYTQQNNEGGSPRNAVYGYEKHYEEQPYYLQIENEKNSWLQKFNIF